MSWWGKLIGGTFGFMMGGPLGALVGIAFGHNFDAGLRKTLDFGEDEEGYDARERTQTAFFTATFAIMGHLAKADGKVTEDEIKLAGDVMSQMRLTPELREAAKRLFNEGKRDSFPLDDVLDQLRRECHRRHSLLRMFLEIQFQAAYADGVIHHDERRLLLHICGQLGFSRHDFDTLEAMVKAQGRFHAGAGRTTGGPTLEDAYAVLDVTPESNAREVKLAYRRLMSQHHPDKLVAKGLPEEMIKVATQKSQEIKAAYEKIKEAHGH